MTVPVEPSEAMIDAIAAKLKPTPHDWVARFYEAREIYRAMLEAARKS